LVKGGGTFVKKNGLRWWKGFKKDGKSDVSQPGLNDPERSILTSIKLAENLTGEGAQKTDLKRRVQPATVGWDQSLRPFFRRGLRPVKTSHYEKGVENGVNRDQNGGKRRRLKRSTSCLQWRALEQEPPLRLGVRGKTVMSGRSFGLKVGKVEDWKERNRLKKRGEAPPVRHLSLTTKKYY